MINLIFRLFLTFNATSLIIVVYLIKSKTIFINKLHPLLAELPHWVSYSIYFLLPVLLTYLSLLLSRFLSNDSIEFSDDYKNVPLIKEIEQANNAYLPSYLGYFFVALSISFCSTLGYVFGILFLFTFLSQTLYFNPLFLVFGYHFYYLTTHRNIKIFIITKQQLKDPEGLEFKELKRINNFTFIHKKEKL
ncbi:MAG: hypothetical protein WCK78_17605 [Paludibacter sp.]